MDHTTKNLHFPLPRSREHGGRLEEDVCRLIAALGTIDRELWKTMQANVLLEDGGAGMYAQLLAVLATTAKTEGRMTRVELELLKLSGSGGGNGGTEGGDNPGNPGGGGEAGGPVEAGDRSDTGTGDTGELDGIGDTLAGAEG